VLETVTAFLDWFGVCVFAMTGALVASRKQMDIVGFALMGRVTGIGGGTIRDVLLWRHASVLGPETGLPGYMPCRIRCSRRLRTNIFWRPVRLRGLLASGEWP
jgi:hypothetical protein